MSGASEGSASNRKRRHRSAVPFFFLSPFLLIFLIFWALPLFQSLSMSLQDEAAGGSRRFIGLRNYRLVLTDRRFWFAVANTMAFTLAFVGVQVPCSLGLALLLNRWRLRGRRLLALMFFSTYLIGPVFVALLFGALFAPRDGLVAHLLLALRFNDLPDWLNDPRWVMPVMLLAAYWLAIGAGMIYLLAALRAVDSRLYEAARIDGAGALSRVWHVTLPQLRSTLLFLVVLGTVTSLQLFELPWILFGGAGPAGSALTIVMYLFFAFLSGNLGFASAVGWILVAIIMLIACAQIAVARLGGKESDG